MPSKRPEPLSEEYLEPSTLPGAAGATLLGRTQNVLPVSGVKKQLAEAPAALVRTATPGHLARLTPIGGPSPLGSSRGRAQPHQWTFTHPFTPIATPSPTASYSLFHRGYGASTAVELAKAALTPRGDAPPIDSRSVEAARLATTDAHASLFSRPVTYAITPTSARATGLAGPQGMTHGRRVSLQQALMPASSAKKPCAKEYEEERDDDDDESGDEEGAEGQPQALRRPEDVPKPPPGALHPSLGSEGHAIGACKRCCFFPRGRCMNGYECMFCHYEHEKRKRKNKKKGKKGAVAPLPLRIGSGIGPLPTHSSLGVTMPGYMPQARPSIMMPTGYQPGQLLYSTPQVVPMATQQDLLAPFQMNSAAYCVMQPTQTVMTAPTMATYSAVQQPQQLIVLEPASMPQMPQQPQQRQQHLEPPPPPAQAPNMCQTQFLPPPPAAAPKFGSA
mmetsp:Transcript_62198/g.161310  ORF Transcript_62198/g.161310 Transcript_62198/m.161310 type:complete len:447 (-) Transcript_62198:412-1752(-)|eukprot:CAMPEP_0115422832 /NCGR_PEP_ID=MMETSP0271-20121206/26986_1 /TAXON_ID=71861 /ORGANISM="Scrippsiella trochoidea, Strain CCMP3099" /LENGTH=446 /DNA_ID=CAMNT_0002847549 /DNA_START=65 /DNA_END=1405 /DNA_ORIENTATION=+